MQQSSARLQTSFHSKIEAVEAAVARAVSGGALSEYVSAFAVVEEIKMRVEPIQYHAWRIALLRGIVDAAIAHCENQTDLSDANFHAALQLIYRYGDELRNRDSAYGDRVLHLQAYYEKQ